MIDDGSGDYYRNVTLEANQDGTIEITAADPASLVFVEAVEVEVVVNLRVSGNKSVPCVELEPPAISREGNDFTVLLAETELPDDIALLGAMVKDICYFNAERYFDF